MRRDTWERLTLVRLWQFLAVWVDEDTRSLFYKTDTSNNLVQGVSPIRYEQDPQKIVILNKKMILL